MADQKPTLILLHGALGTKEEFHELLPKLSKRFELHPLTFEGHGEERSISRPFRIDHFVENVLGYLNEKNITQTNIFGYSMGGFVALTLAKHQPDRVKKVSTLGTVLQWSKEVADRECGFLNPEVIEKKVPHFAKELKKRHPNGWKKVVHNTREMLQYLGTHPDLVERDWDNIQIPTRFHVGDRDATAGLASTIEVYTKMQEAELSVLPGTPHPFDQVNKEKLAYSLKEFYLG